MTQHGYRGISLSSGVHDVRTSGYQHPWLVVTADEVVGCWSRQEAREVYRQLQGAETRCAVLACRRPGATRHAIGKALCADCARDLGEWPYGRTPASQAVLSWL